MLLSKQLVARHDPRPDLYLVFDGMAGFGEYLPCDGYDETRMTHLCHRSVLRRLSCDVCLATSVLRRLSCDVLTDYVRCRSMQTKKTKRDCARC